MAKKKQDEPTGVKEEVEAPTQDVPASESPKEEVVVDQPQPEPEEQTSPEAETGKNEEAEVPKDNAAWAKMRTENKRLKEVLDNVDQEYLDKLRDANKPMEYQPQSVQPMDESADYSQVTGALNTTQQEVSRLRQDLISERNQREVEQDRQAEEAFPELKTNREFEQMVSEKKLVARVLGHPRTTLEIAREVKNLLSKREEQVKVQAVEETKQQIAEKQVATAEARGQTSGGVSGAKDEELRKRMRKGDMDATTDVAKGIIGDLDIS